MREHSRLWIRRWRFGGHPNVSSPEEAFGLRSPRPGQSVVTWGAEEIEEEEPEVERK